HHNRYLYLYQNPVYDYLLLESHPTQLLQPPAIHLFLLLFFELYGLQHSFISLLYYFEFYILLILTKFIKRDFFFNKDRLILDEIDNTLSHVKDSEAETFLKQIIEAEQVFVSGKGRSGCVANSFAMRLNQLVKGAHVVGEWFCCKVEFIV